MPPNEPALNVRGLSAGDAVGNDVLEYAVRQFLTDDAQVLSNIVIYPLCRSRQRVKTAYMALPLAIAVKLNAKRDELAREKQLLDAQRAEVARVERCVELLEAELAGWEGAASEFAALLDASPSPSIITPVTGPENGTTIAVRKMWRDILAATAPQHPYAVSLDEFEKIANGLGTPTTRNTLRSQLSNYKRHGLLESVGYGRFRLTPEGARILGVALPAVPANGIPKPADPAPDLLGAAATFGNNIHHEHEGEENG